MRQREQREQRHRQRQRREEHWELRREWQQEQRKARPGRRSGARCQRQEWNRLPMLNLTLKVTELCWVVKRKAEGHWEQMEKDRSLLLIRLLPLRLLLLQLRLLLLLLVLRLLLLFLQLLLLRWKVPVFPTPLPARRWVSQL